MTDEASACSVAGRVLSALQEPIGVHGRRVAIDASIGIALPSDVQDAHALLRHADRALYAAKAAGKGCWRVHVPPPVITPGRPTADGLPVPRSEEALPVGVPHA